MGKDGRRSDVDEKSEVGTGKEGCAVVMSSRAWKGIEAHEWKE